MLNAVLFCWTLALAHAVNEFGYNYEIPEVIPSIQIGEIHSPPQCSEGYSGQYPNCVLSSISQYLPPTPPPSQYLPATPPPSQNLPPAQCPSNTIGYYPDCHLPQPPITVPPPQQCPTGTIGYYPHCQVPPTPPPPPQCPSGSDGIFPNCRILHTTPPPECPSGTIGYYPNCQLTPTPPPQCPFGFVGQYPDCRQPEQCPPGTVGYYPDCQLPQQPIPVSTPTPQCPPGTVGYYPDCQLPQQPIPVSTPTPQCPPGTVGYYPDCQLPQQPIPVSTPSPQCPPGTVGYYPDCQLPQQPIPVSTPTPQCPPGSVGQVPYCRQHAQDCPPGTFGFYPYCVSYDSTPSTPQTAITRTTPVTVRTPTPRAPPECPSGTVGKFPKCKKPTPSRKYIPKPPLHGEIETPLDGETEPPPVESCIIGWEEYKTRFDKKYDDANEEVNRQVLFLKSQERIAAHNALYKNDEVSYSLCTNQFSDWTQKEYESILGLDHTDLPYEPDTPGIDSTDPDDDDEGYIYGGGGEKSQSSLGGGGGGGLGAAAGGKVDDEKDWRKDGAVTPIKYQKNCASCWAFSAAAALESHFLIKKKSSNLDLSEQQLIDCTKNLGNRGCDKGYMHNAYMYAEMDGLGFENENPYVASDNKSCVPRTNQLKNMGYQNVTADEREIKDVVFNNGPVSVGMCATYDFKELGPHGVYNDPKCTKQINHAVLIVGYGHDPKKRMDYWIIKNSFNTMWGNQGFGRIVRGTNHCGIASLASYPIVY